MKALTKKQEDFCIDVVVGSRTPHVYALVDSLSGSVFYVGKGHGRRMFNHEADARRGKPGAKCDKIREIISSGGSVEYRVLAVFNTDSEAFEAEKMFIADYANLTNITAGGGGCAATGGAAVVNAAKELFSRLKPYSQWVNSLCEERLAMVLRVWGSPTACYEHIAGSLRENAGVA